MDKKACAFTGHRVILGVNMLKPKLRDKIVELINSGYNTFYNGGAIGFDTYCALEIIELKKQYDITLNMILPCKDQDVKWSKSQREAYRYILKNSDSIEYVSNTYENGCMQKRNRILCEKCDLIFAYLNRSCGGTYFTVNYAKKLNKDIFNIANI